MATGTEAIIADLLFARLATLTTSPATTFAWPNDNFNGSLPYLEVMHMPNRTLGPLLDTSEDHRGILQVTVVFENGHGLIDPFEIASQVVDHFPVTLRLGTSVLVSIPEPGYAAPPIQEDNEIRIPVSIPYRASL